MTCHKIISSKIDVKYCIAWFCVGLESFHLRTQPLELKPSKGPGKEDSHYGQTKNGTQEQLDQPFLSYGPSPYGVLHK